MITGFLGKLLLSGTGIGILAYLSICIALFFGQQHLIFLPSSVLEYTPKDLDLAHEDVWLSVLNFDSLSKLKLLKIPLLLIHGTNDRTIPATMSQRLFEVAKIPKRLFLVANADHNNVASTSGENYLQQVREFEHLVRQNQRQLADKSRWQN